MQNSGLKGEIFSHHKAENKNDKIKNYEIRNALSLEKLQDTCNRTKNKGKDQLEDQNLLENQLKRDFERRGISYEEMTEEQLWEDRDRWNLLSWTQSLHQEHKKR